jgi:hypothetical protein
LLSARFFFLRCSQGILPTPQPDAVPACIATTMADVSLSQCYVDGTIALLLGFSTACRDEFEEMKARPL